MMICPKHNQQIQQHIQVWGLAYLLPASRAQHMRRMRASTLGSKRLEDFDPMGKFLRCLEALLEGQFGYDDDEDEDPNCCVICDNDADNLLDMAAAATITDFHMRRGPVS